MQAQSGTQPGTESGQSGQSGQANGQSGTRNRGFASMDAEKQREIARKGGKAAHQKGTAHEFTADEARAAGRKGGQQVSANRVHMSRIGRIGGKSSATTRRQSGRDTEDNGSGGMSDRGPEGQGPMGHPGDGGGHHAEAVRGTGGESSMEDAGLSNDDGRASEEQPESSASSGSDVPSPS